MYLEPEVEGIFYEDSYGYRPGKSAIQALEVTRKRCWQYNWVLEFDIKGLFDYIRHDYMLEMVKRHTAQKWIVLYVERWLKTPFQLEDGNLIPRESGTPQGGVISPVLANLFMHYAFDSFMEKSSPSLAWARYADDGIIHCKTYRQAQYLCNKLKQRLEVFGLELNQSKTKIIYCKDVERTEQHENTSFDFLGYTFRARPAKSKYNHYYIRFLPAISDTAKKSIRREVRRWRLQRRVYMSLQDIAEQCNRKIQGWINYYSHFYKSEVWVVMRYINQCLLKWVQRKYSIGKYRAIRWLKRFVALHPDLFAHWKLGIRTAAR